MYYMFLRLRKVNIIVKVYWKLNLSPINFNTRQSEFAQCNSSICCQGDFKLIFKFQQQDVNTLTTDEDYSRENRENLPRTLQTQQSDLSAVFLLYFWNLN